jgi:hypothetical protein
LKLCVGGLFVEVSEEASAIGGGALDHVEGDLGASFGLFPIVFPEVGESDEIIGGVLPLRYSSVNDVGKG